MIYKINGSAFYLEHKLDHHSLTDIVNKRIHHIEADIALWDTYYMVRVQYLNMYEVNTKLK